MRYLLDTSFMIDTLRGDAMAHRRFAAILADGDSSLVNEVVVAELWAGAPTGDLGLPALLGATEFIQPGADAAANAGRWRAEARQRGFTLSLADALIASAADAVGATVLTRNVRDFSLTPVPHESY